mmetsp:Transcript_11554/g.32417  ORF Transcript_11554/g.32417 Transcript_11554/m.32417 type:complete len:548 (+) Transcript_11554:2714-4357(+)
MQSRGPGLSHRALELQTHELVHLCRKLQWQLVEHLPTEPRDDHSHRLLRADAALLEVEELILANLGRGSFMLDLRRRVPHLDVRIRIGRSRVSYEHGIALGEIPGTLCGWLHLYEPPVHVAALAGRDSLGDDAGAGPLAHVDHLGARIGLLLVVRQSHRVKLADGVVSLENHRRVLPRDGAAGLDLGPGDLGLLAPADAALRHKVVDAPEAVFVSCVPILHRAIFDFGPGSRAQLNDGRVELVLVVGRGRAPLQIRYIRVVLADDERALKLPCLGRIDSKVRTELHGGLDALGHVHEGAIREDSRVEGREVVVRDGDHGSQVLFNQIRVLFDRLADAAEDDPGLQQLLLEGGGDRHRVKHRVHRHVGQPLLLGQRDPELVEGRQKLRVHLVQRLLRLLHLGSTIVAVALVVDGRVVVIRPIGLLHRQPLPERLEPEVQHPLRLVFLRANGAHDVLGQALGEHVRFDYCLEAVLVRLGEHLLDVPLLLRDGVCRHLFRGLHAGMRPGGRVRGCTRPLGRMGGFTNRGERGLVRGDASRRRRGQSVHGV